MLRLCGCNLWHVQAGKEALTKVESSHKQSIIKLNKGRTAEADRTVAELAVAKAELDKLRLAYHGSMSRRKVLETEVGGRAAVATNDVVDLLAIRYKHQWPGRTRHNACPQSMLSFLATTAASTAGL